MNTKTKSTLLAQIKKAESYLENGDPIEASEVLDMAYKTCTNDDIKRTISQARSETDHGTIERAEHLLWNVKYELRQLATV